MDWIAGPYFDHIAAFEVRYHSTLFKGGAPACFVDTSDVSLAPRPFGGETAW